MIKPKPWVYVCPACGNKPLQQEALNPFSGYGAKLLGKLFKR